MVYALPWTTPGGDYFATPEATHSAPTAGTMLVDVTAHAQLLLEANTGLIVRKTSGAAIRFALKSSPQAPVLAITTNLGTFDCPCETLCWIDSSASYPITDQIGAPALMRFDLSSVQGSLISAQLRWNVSIVYSGSAPQLAINVLDLPTLVTSPSAAIGNPTPPAAVSGDYLFEVDCTDETTIRENFRVVHLAVGSIEYIPDPDGFTWARINASLEAETQANWIRFAQPTNASPTALNGAAWRRSYVQGESLGYDEVYFQFRFRIGEGFYDAFNEQGCKLPGLEGRYEYSSSGAVTSPPPVTDGTWEGRLWHGGKHSKHRGLYRGAIYWYGMDHPINQYYGTPGGLDRYFNQCNFMFKEGVDYTIEYHVKMNTIINNVPQSDGVLEVWIDAVLVHRETNVLIRKYPEVQIQSIPIMQWYHGGTGNYPLAPCYVEWGAIKAATRYIGIGGVDEAPVVNGQMALEYNSDGTIAEKCWNLPLNQFVEVLGTDMVSHLTPLLPPGFIDHGVSKLPQVFEAYSGSAFDPTGLKQYFKGGGHQASSNNGVAEFDFERMTWRWAMSPSIISSGDISAAVSSWNSNGVAWVGYFQANPYPNDYWADGKPSATHTYNALVWRASVGEVLFPGRYSFWRINPVAGNAIRLGGYSYSTTLTAVYDEVTQNCYVFSPGGSAAGHYWHYHKVNLQTGVIGPVVSLGSPRFTQELQPVIIGRKIWCFSDNEPSQSAPRLWTIDMDTDVVTNVTLTGHPARTPSGSSYLPHTGLGCVAVHGTKIYAPHRAVNGSGTWGTCTVIETTTGQVTQYTPSGTPPGHASGTIRMYGKFKIFTRGSRAYMTWWNVGTENLRLVRIA